MLTSKKKLGFTLIELLVVISVIGLLASVILVALNASRVKARDAKRKADFKQLQTALEFYYSQYDGYPGEAGWCDSSKGVTADICAGFVSNGWPANGLKQLETSGIVSKLPTDPSNSDYYFYYYEPVLSQTQFAVACGTSPCAYMLSTLLEGETGDPGCHVSYPIHNYCVSGGGANGRIP